MLTPDALKVIYMRNNALPARILNLTAKVDSAFAKRVGILYDLSPIIDFDALDDYNALASEVIKQAEFLFAHGYSFEFHKEHDEPYLSSDDMRHDILTHNKMLLFSTANGFGGEPFQHEWTLINDVNFRLKWDANPMLKWYAPLSTEDAPVLINDLFRFVHDFFGHVLGNNTFSALGEENAWRQHMPMFTPSAQYALTCETRAQNCWVNYGPHIVTLNKDKPGYVTPSERPFATQKLIALPSWVLESYL